MPRCLECEKNKTIEETKNNASLPGIRQKTPHKTCGVFCIPSDKFGNTTRKRSVFSCQICFAFSASRYMDLVSHRSLVSCSAILSANFIHIVKTVENTLHIPHKKCYNHCEKNKKGGKPYGQL